MALQTLPRATERYLREQQRLTRGSVREVRRLWRQMGEEFDRSWLQIAPAMLAVTDATQLRVAESAAEYVPAVLAETSGAAPALAGDVVPDVFVGVAGDGRPTESLLRGAVVQSKTAVGAGATTRQALLSGLSWLTMATATLMSDTGRGAEVAGMARHNGVSYVRALVPPSCSRCAILAGATYRSEVAFQRHPRCDCRHVPIRGMDYSDAVDEGLVMDPHSYFESLPESEQDRIFTNAGAEAIRNGADPRQVVNARRGMHVAQGRLVTTEGTTRRGLAYKAMGGPSREDVRRSGERYFSSSRARLMPETIQRIAGGSQERYRQLLIEYWYLRPSVPRFIYSPSGQLVRI